MRETLSEAVKRIQPELEQEVSPHERDRHLEELPKGEELLRWVEKDNPARPDLILVLTRIYNILNRQLGVICRELKYPPNQSEWRDSLPLDVMGKVWEGIEVTNWYQWQLGQMLSEQNHPWVNIITTSDNPQPSLFPELEE